MPKDAIAKLLKFCKSLDNWLNKEAAFQRLENLLGDINKMNDAKILDELKDELKSAKTTPSSKNGKRQTSGDSAKAGANRIAQFINDVSDKASDQVADAITAAVVHKSMQKLGIGNGPLTEMAISQFDAAFTEVLVVQLPYLTGADGGEQSEFFLPPASNGVGKNFN